MSVLRRRRGLHLPSLLWFLFLTFDVGGVHQCSTGHHGNHAASASASMAPMAHDHAMAMAMAMPMPAPEQAPAPDSRTPCDCLSLCCTMSVVTVPTPGIVALPEQFLPALPPGHVDPVVAVSVPSDLLPFSRPPPTLL